MLFPARILQGLTDGSVDRAFRRWDRPRVRSGGRQRTGVGVIGFTSVDAVARETLTDEDAKRAGFASLGALLAFVDRRPDRQLYRIGLTLLGPDPRERLRATVPDGAQQAEIETRLARLDGASRHGPWTLPVMLAIRDRPGVPAADLAASFGRERMPFKLDVRKLKELGLTESLRPGYRLSPRGEAVVATLAERR